jgi:hypothetical protein
MSQDAKQKPRPYFVLGAQIATCDSVWQCCWKRCSQRRPRLWLAAEAALSLRSCYKVQSTKCNNKVQSTGISATKFLFISYKLQVTSYPKDKVLRTTYYKSQSTGTSALALEPKAAAIRSDVRPSCSKQIGADGRLAGVPARGLGARVGALAHSLLPSA